MQKIEFDKARGDSLQAEKKMLLETRFAVRRQAEQQKMAMMKTVEMMKKRGTFDKEELAALGINVKSSMKGSDLASEDSPSPHKPNPRNNLDLESGVADARSLSFKTRNDSMGSKTSNPLNHVDDKNDQPQMRGRQA